jgi:antitoxin Phd
MNINTETLVSMTEANQNFSKVARLVDEKGLAVIMKNNTPRYVVMDFSQLKTENSIADESVIELSKRFLEQNREAYLELAK